jgi:hypothetical protein
VLANARLMRHELLSLEVLECACTPKRIARQAQIRLLVAKKLDGALEDRVQHPNGTGRFHGAPTPSLLVQPLAQES